MADKTGAVTVRLEVAVKPPLLAVIAAIPEVTAVARPLALTVATEVFDDVYVEDDVRFCVLLSEYIPVTVYC